MKQDIDGLNVDYVTIPDSWGGRDKGKVFRIKEWPARRAEEWAWGMVFALKGTRGELPEDVARLGMAGIGVALLNTVLKSDVSYDAIKPFMNELIDECVTIVRDPKNRDRTTGEPIATPLMTNDLLEIRSFQFLRSEVIRVHTNFSVLDALSALISAAKSGLPTDS